MRVFCLLACLFLGACVCEASDQLTQAGAPDQSSSAHGDIERSVSRHSRFQRRQFRSSDRDEISRDENACLMLRTYIVVRENQYSDVTRRDGEVICQPAWKFQTRSAVVEREDR